MPSPIIALLEQTEVNYLEMNISGSAQRTCSKDDFKEHISTRLVSL